MALYNTATKELKVLLLLQSIATQKNNKRGTLANNGHSICVSGHVQDRECMQHLGTCRALMYLQGVTQGEWVPAECLSRSVIMYKSKYIHGGLYLSRSEKKAAFSFYSSPALYNRQVTQRKELNKKAVTHY